MNTFLAAVSSSCLLRRRLLAGVLALSLVSCRSEPKDLITLQVGPEQVIRFEAKTGFAHYFELPGEEDLLRIVLASYPLSCQEYRAPKPGEVFVTVSIRVPSNRGIKPGTFSWVGLPNPPKGEDKTEKLPKEKEPEEDLGSALPFVRLAADARALPPGGAVKLTDFEAEAFGLVKGEMAFRDADAGQGANTALLGLFSVRLCHIDLDPARRAPPEGT